MDAHIKNADFAWLLIGKEYRISRSIRMDWLFQHLNQVVSPKSDEQIINSTEELELLSILNGGISPRSFDDKPAPLRITPATKLTFVGRQYRFVFYLDMSSSLANIDVMTGHVLTNELFTNLKNVLTALVQPFCVPGSGLVLSPKLHITILAGSSIVSKQCQVLVQGYCVNDSNVNALLCVVKQNLQKLENMVVQNIIEYYGKLANDSTVGNEFGMSKSETGLYHMIRDCLLALQLLPDNASAGIIILTDGVFNLDNALVADALLAQLRVNAANCSFLQIGNGYGAPSFGFGYVPHCALMQFIATATSGAYLAGCPPVNVTSGYAMNIYHECLLLWNIQRDVDRERIHAYHDSLGLGMYMALWEDQSRRLTTDSGVLELAALPHQTIPYMSVNLQTKITSVLSVRLREGYTLDQMRILKTKEGQQIDVKLTWPWKEHVNVEYFAKAKWPIDHSNLLTQVNVKISGPYDFLCDITSTKPKQLRTFRKAVIQRFETTMKELDYSDLLLVQLQSFSSNSASYTIPVTVQKKLPLFYMPPNSNSPILALQYGKSKKSEKSPEAMFANFWKNVVMLDTKTWQKWFHCHRLSILLEHDRPIPSGLYFPSSIGHFPSVHCRAAFLSLTQSLKEWCSFVLLENHSYIKIMQRPNEDVPYSFCLARLVFKGLCIVIRVAFLGGTAGKDRCQAVTELRSVLSATKAPVHKLSVQEDSAVVSSGQTRGDGKASSCLIFLTKQLERILVKYDRVSDEVRMSLPTQGSGSVDREDGENLLMPQEAVAHSTASVQSPYGHQLMSRLQTPASLQEVLSHYLFNQRWVWEMTCSGHPSLVMQSVSQILTAITKMRLFEGFHFCSSINGIISLVKEVPVMSGNSEDHGSNCCIIQYILFPPHRKLLCQPVNHDDSTDMEGLQEKEGDLQMVTEIWVEPQHGTFDVIDTNLGYLHGCKYHEVPAKIFSVDAQIVTEISTCVHLHALCQKNVLNKFSEERFQRPSVTTDIYNSSTTVLVPFLFDIIPLLLKSRLEVHMYPLLKYVNQDATKIDKPDLNDVFLGYLLDTLSNMHDNTIALHQSEASRFCTYIYERCLANAETVWLGQCTPVIRKSALSEKIQWRCFVKSFGTCLIILIAPASVKDVRMLIDSGHNEMKTALSVDKTGEQANVPAHGSHTYQASRLNFPFFIFECEYALIQKVPSSFPSGSDMLQDYTRILSDGSAHVGVHQTSDSKSKEMLLYSQALHERYLWALVSGVYRCLQNRCKLDSEDVELAVELVCDDTTKQIDITNFIHVLCSHYQRTGCSELLKPKYEVLKHASALWSSSDDRPYSFRARHSSSSSSSAQGSKGSLGLRLQCETYDLQNDVKQQFMEILGKSFKPVPECSYLFFFDGEVDYDLKQDQSGGSSVISQLSEVYDEADTLSMSGAESEDIGEMADDEESNLDEQQQLDTDEIDPPGQITPMFLLLTCSCHYKSLVGSAIRQIPVTTLPTCLADILGRLEEGGSSIDPYSPNLEITLDLICLTQPCEPDEGADWKAPDNMVLERQESNESFSSGRSSASENPEDKTQRLAQEQHEKESACAKPEADSLKLPRGQDQAVKDTLQEIEWLLEDEIASALRSQSPIKEESLAKVANHVKTSRTENCLYTRRFLSFVSGIEKNSGYNLCIFIIELEGATLDQYVLKQIGQYYCLVLNPDIYDGSESVASAPQLAELKERAKNVRKGLGHRRSQSDFTDKRKPKDSFREVTENTIVNSRSQSLPSVHVPSNFGKIPCDTKQAQIHVDSKNVANQPCNAMEGSCILPVMGISNKNDFQESQHAGETSSKGDSSSSLQPENEGEYLRRTLTFSGTHAAVQRFERRRFSMPDVRCHYPSVNKDNIQDGDSNSVGNPAISAMTDDEISGFQGNDFEEPEHTAEEYANPSDEETFRSHPDFWLFLKIQETEQKDHYAEVYFHRRRSENPTNVDLFTKVYERLIAAIDQTCKIVNQRNLLEHLNETRQCNNLLLASDEEYVWDTQENSSGAIAITKERLSLTNPFGNVVHGEYMFQPGHFECEMVWQKDLPLHPRLCAGQHVSRGLNCVFRVLNQFRVSNRKNLFVYKESASNVFYFRVQEASYTSNTRAMFDETDETMMGGLERRLSGHSLSSSMHSLTLKQLDMNTDQDQVGRIADDRASMSEHPGWASAQSVDVLQFCVYGICEPTSEVKVDLINLLTKKLDAETLAILHLSLHRNSKMKLTPRDVEFIQPQGQPPALKFRIVISSFAGRFLHALIYYLHQHLLMSFHMPRFTETNKSCHFKNYVDNNATWNLAEPIDVNDLYLYVKADKGKTGIGIIYLSLVDEEERKVVAQPYYPTACHEVFTTEEQLETLARLLDVHILGSADEANALRDKCNAFVEFKIWERGEIGLEDLELDLLQMTRRALCDVFLEFFFICAPICTVPQELVDSIPSRRSSFTDHKASFVHIHPALASSATSSTNPTPKLAKIVDVVKRFYSEPTTPIDFAKKSSPVPALKIKEKDHVRTQSSSPASMIFRDLGASPSHLASDDTSLSKASGRRASGERTTSRPSSVIEGPYSGGHSGQTGSEIPKTTISLSELNQMKLPAAATYVMFTDDEVRESFRALVDDEKAKERSDKSWKDVEQLRRRMQHSKKERRAYENGGQGELHPNYANNVKDVFDRIKVLGDHAVGIHEMQLTHSYPAESALKDIVKVLSDLSPDIKPKVYKEVVCHVDGGSDGGTDRVNYIRYRVDRAAVKSEETSESSMDVHRSGLSLIPGAQWKFFLIGRNAHKWLLSMGSNPADLSDDEEGKSLQEEKCKQLFGPLQPAELGALQDRSRAEVTAPTCISFAFVPRQKFYIATFFNKKMTLYTYNFTLDTEAELVKQLKRVFAWHNARSHAMSCIAMQKMGLFHHRRFKRDCPDKLDSDLLFLTSCDSPSHMWTLMSEPSPVAPERLKMENDSSKGGANVPFDTAFMNNAPHKPMHKRKPLRHKSFVWKIAFQCNEVRLSRQAASKHQLRLKEICETWQQAGGHVPITSHNLMLLKNHSRLIHYCLAPIMFMQMPSDQSKVEAVKSQSLTTCSDETDGYRSLHVDQEDWCDELQWSLVQQYIQYLQTLGLCVVPINSGGKRGALSSKARPPSRRQSNKPSDSKDVATSDERPAVQHLQRSSVGGIILFEISCQNGYLCFKMYSCGTGFLTNLTHKTGLKDRRHFTKDCKRFKDLSHLNSFTYDFHIRHIQMHLAGRHSVFRRGYPVHQLMEIIMHEYPKPPMFSRCLLLHGIVSLPCTPGLSPSTVFQYLIVNASSYHMTKVHVGVKAREPNEPVEPTEYILTYASNAKKEPVQTTETWRMRRDVTEYDGNVTLHFMESDSSDVLNLPFFVILADKKEPYPKPQLLANMGSMRRSRNFSSSGPDVLAGKGEEPSIAVSMRRRVHFSINESESTPPEPTVVRRSPSCSSLTEPPAERSGNIRISESDTSLVASHLCTQRLSPHNSWSSGPSLSRGDSIDETCGGDKSGGKLSMTLESFLLNESKFVLKETSEARSFLNRKVGACLSNCWRDMLWHQLLVSDAPVEEDAFGRKIRKRLSSTPKDALAVSFDEWKADNMLTSIKNVPVMAINVSELKLMLNLVSRFSLKEIDPRIAELFMFVHPSQLQVIARSLASKYGSLLRRFATEDGKVAYLCILNPGIVDMMVLITTDELEGRLDFEAVFRRPPVSSPVMSLAEESLRPEELAARSHIEDVITCLCFNIWTGLLPAL